MAIPKTSASTSAAFPAPLRQLPLPFTGFIAFLGPRNFITFWDA
jgi:hypothetical protein